MADVFIPNKKNKEGKKFAFVRFREVAFPMELEKRLDQIWIGTFKLRVNCTKFYRRRETQSDRKDRNIAPMLESKTTSNAKINRTDQGATFDEVVRV